MPKRIGNIRKEFLTRERLLLIVEDLMRPEKSRRWTVAQRKRWQEFADGLPDNIDRLARELRARVYKPRPFIEFDKKEGPKTRHIYESWPIDLVADTLLLDCLNHVFFERKHIIPDSCYGSIRGKGQHELRAKIIRLVRGRSDLYVYTGDTAKYYPSMHHGVLMDAFRRHIKDKWLLWLCEVCVGRIEGMRGIALGLPSSNPIGHIYHALMDWFVVLTLKVRRYYRFCDDKWMVHRSKDYLHTVARELREHTQTDLQQTLKPSWRIVHCAEERFDCLGAMVNSHGARLKKFNRLRIERTMRKRIRECNPESAFRTWSGIRGSLRELSVSNLVRYWRDRYEEFFWLVAEWRCILRENRRRHRWHAKLERILTFAPDHRSLYNFVMYPLSYGLDYAEERQAA